MIGKKILFGLKNKIKKKQGKIGEISGKFPLFFLHAYNFKNFVHIIKICTNKEIY